MLENMRISIQGIWSHKMRSFLTMLGIIIGIASIIAIVSTIKGTSEQIKEDLIGAGNNTVSVSLNYGDSEYDPEYGMFLISKKKISKILIMCRMQPFFTAVLIQAVYIMRTQVFKAEVYMELMPII